MTNGNRVKGPMIYVYFLLSICLSKSLVQAQQPVIVDGNQGGSIDDGMLTYPNGYQAFWEIHFDAPTTVNIKFSVMDVEPSSNCQFDYLTISNGTRTLRYCGYYLPRQAVFHNTSLLTVEFHADSFTSGRGFDFTYWPDGYCWPGCALSHVEDGNCDEPCNVRQCHYDSYDCIEYPPPCTNGTGYQLCEAYEGQECVTDEYCQTTQGTDCVTWFDALLENTQCESFLACDIFDYDLGSCDLDECALGFDDCMPYTTMCRNTDGSFACDCKPGYSRLPGDEPNECYDTQFPRCDSGEGYALCGTSECLGDDNCLAHGFNNCTDMLTSYRTDTACTDFLNCDLYGFDDRMCESCGTVIDGSTGGLIDDGFDVYPNSHDCSWTITFPKVTGVSLHFCSMKVEPDKDCEYDYVSVSFPTGGMMKYCGFSVPPPVTLVTDTLNIAFHSDLRTRSEGFKLAFLPSGYCGPNCPIVGGECDPACALDTVCFPDMNEEETPSDDSGSSGVSGLDWPAYVGIAVCVAALCVLARYVYRAAMLYCSPHAKLFDKGLPIPDADLDDDGDGDEEHGTASGARAARGTHSDMQYDTRLSMEMDAIGTHAYPPDDERAPRTSIEYSHPSHASL